MDRPGILTGYIPSRDRESVGEHRRNWRVAGLRRSGSEMAAHERPLRFAFISNAVEIGEALQRSARAESEDIVIRQATMEEAVPVARRLLDEGVEVIIGGGGTGSMLAQTLGHPVVKIARSHLDILRVLHRAREHGTFIALTSFHEPASGIDLFEDLLRIRVRQIVFDDSRQLKSGVAAAIAEGVDCVVGGGVCRRIAEEFGHVGLVVMPGTDAVDQALREARALAMARRRERAELQRVQTILDLIKDGIVLMADDGTIAFANPAAVKLLESGAAQSAEIATALGLAEVARTGRARVDQICRTGGRDLVVNALPIRVDGRIDGAVATFKDATRIQNLDRKLKEKLYLRGFVARYTLRDIHGASERMRRVIDDLQRYALADATVLVEGESGVGKEIFAQSIHNLSKRRERPFVAVNCSALSESLLESELFGYEDGAFTGARRGGKIGLFELAQGGTLFLDEIADVSPSLQSKLLRVLEEKEIMRVGGDRNVPVDVRVVSSTYKNLFAEVKQRRFRNDLYFRLAALHITVPPLRERREDIPALIHASLAARGAPADAVTDAMIALTSDYDWPGNVRELDSLVQRFLILRSADESDAALFARLFAEMRDAIGMDAGPEQDTEFAAAMPTIDAEGALKDRVLAYERHVIAQTLRSCRFNKRLTARILGISVNTLWRKLPRATEH
jgi:transcriptional regulator, propionate catabolism operon regulatory protein